MALGVVEVFGWINEHREHLLQALGAVIALMSVINKLTPHYSLSGPLRVLRLISEQLSVLTSKGARTRLGPLKAPFQSVPPKQPVAPDFRDKWPPGTMLIVLLALGWIGCSSAQTTQDVLRTTRAAIVGIHPVGAERIHKHCIKLARECFAKGDKACEAGAKCMQARKRYDAAVIAVHDSLAVIADVLRGFDR